MVNSYFFFSSQPFTATFLVVGNNINQRSLIVVFPQARTSDLLRKLQKDERI